VQRNAHSATNAADIGASVGAPERAVDVSGDSHGKRRKRLMRAALALRRNSAAPGLTPYSRS
jgi:hypothetical protein